MIQTILYHGFRTNLWMWVIALVTHTPGVHIPSPVKGLALILAFAFGTALAGRSLSNTRPWLVGAGVGLLAALLNLMLLGSLLVEQPVQGSPQAGTEGLAPNAILVIGGFLVGCTVLGALCGFVGGSFRGHVMASGFDPIPQPWLERFLRLMAWSLVPLILVGGLVTSADAGMSVRGWPASDGAFMFLYPISLMTDDRVFFEHSHRLLGSLVGLTVLTGMIWVLLAERQVLPRGLAIGLFLLVCIQGYLGGARVNLDSRIVGVIHGISAQLIMALAWLLAMLVSAAFRHATPVPHPLAGRLRGLSIALLIGLVIQLTLGAAFRHLGASKPGMVHMIYTHAALAIVLVILAALMGFGLKKAAEDAAAQGHEHAGPAKRAGGGLVHATMTQFLLGWLTFWLVISNRPAAGRAGAVPGPTELATTPKVPIAEAITATLHQTLGAAILALAVLSAGWIWRLLRSAR